MLIGVPKEIKVDEYRVGLVPATIKELTARGHEVLVQACAGEGADISDDEYAAVGGRIVDTADEIFSRAQLIVKVKEPLNTERKKLRRGQIIFTYLHLAPDLNQAQDLMASGATAIAYETVTDAAGRLPLLAPMSKVAGRMAAQVAAHFLERPQGGRGVLLGAIDGFPAAEIMVLGGWRCRLQCRRDSARHGRQGDRHRPAGRNFKSTCRAIRRTRARHGGTTGCNCGALRFGRRCDWSRLGGRRCCPEADLGRYGQANEAGGGYRRYFDRPGRLRRNFAPDDPLAADFCGRRNCALLRRQHAGGGTMYVDLCAK
jgi:hypothetical protein